MVFFPRIPFRNYSGDIIINNVLHQRFLCPVGSSLLMTCIGTPCAQYSRIFACSSGDNGLFFMHLFSSTTHKHQRAVEVHFFYRIRCIRNTQACRQCGLGCRVGAGYAFHRAHPPSLIVPVFIRAYLACVVASRALQEGCC